LVRSRSFHVRPPPETEEKLWLLPLDGPSEVMNATRRSFAAVVVSEPEVIVDAAAD
jgi:hypothetical protein